VELDASGNIQNTFLSLLNPYALLMGVTTIFMLATHGAIYLSMKTDDELLARVKRWVPRLMFIFFILNTLLVGATVLLGVPVAARYLAQPWLVVVPGLALLAVVVAWFMVRGNRYFVAFLFSAVMIAGLLFSAAFGIYPNLLLSTIDAQYNLTIFNSASQANTLTVMLVIALIGMPFVLLYTAGVYSFFRGKVQLSSQSY
jgi:cytochrome d ubiquinol oxidase subunit II